MYDIIIIGGGAAGASAAIFAARNRRKTLLLDKGPEFGALGGIILASDMPGCENLSGAEILNRMKKQAASFGAEVKTAAVTSCIIQESSKRIITNEPVTYETKAVILATGNMSQQDPHAYQGEKELWGRGVSHDAESNLHACKGASVAIIGKSAAVAETALKVSKFADKVYWIIPASKLDIFQDLIDELEKQKKIEPFFSSSLKKINGTTEVSSVTVLASGQEKNFSVKYVFLPPQQHKPITDYLNGIDIQTGPDGVILVGQQFETSIPGIFAAGNILCTKPQLNVVCAAQGTIAAMNADKCVSA